MCDKYIKEVSGKLTIVIRLLISMSKKYKENDTKSLIKLLEGAGFSNQDIANIGGIAVKTVSNTKSKMRNEKI